MRSPSMARRAEATGGACCCWKFVRFDQFNLLVPRDHHLRDLHAARNAKRRFAEVNDDRRDFAAVVAVDRARRVEQRDAVMQRQPGARANLRFVAFRQRNDDTGRHRQARAGFQFDIPIHCGQQIHPRGTRGSIARQRQVASACEVLNGKLHAAFPKAVTMRAVSWRPTSALLIGGQSSTPNAVMRCTVLLSPPMMPVVGDTSLATIQSQPFFVRLACACAITSSVSAAKPMTSAGRFARRAMVERMSGLAARWISGTLPPSRFLSLLLNILSGRQSETAAVNTATSAGKAASHAASISQAVCTFTNFTREGGAISTGPETSVVSAPASANAPAMA